jgi:acetylornithine/N-succinyldiaminopimelate aminotransferase
MSNQLESAYLDEPIPLMQVAPRPNVVMVRGAGSHIWDHDGTRYLDFVQGWAVNSLGHAAPEIQRALSEQAGALLCSGPAFYNGPALELARCLVTSTRLHQAYLCNGGAEANEVAIKLARKWGRLHKGGAYEILSTHGSFHGRSLATMAASGKHGFDTLFPPNLAGFEKVEYGNARAMEAAIGERTVALMVEPIQGEAGVVVPPAGYLRELSQLARRHQLLLIVDEVQTGMGRTGTLFAFEQERIVPDIVTLGKGLGGGVPIAAAVASRAASCFDYGEQGGTYHHNPLMAAVALAVARVVSDPAFLAQVRRRARQLGAGLSRLAREHDLRVRGRGLLWALVLNGHRAERVRDLCFARGLLVNAARPDVIRFMPSLRVARAEVEEMLAILGPALQTCLSDQ